MSPRRPGRAGKRRRFRFSLNALAIQLSAFALSFTLVAVLVVSGSQAAFVEENESVATYVPPPATPPAGEDADDYSPRRPGMPSATPTPAPAAVPPTEEPEPSGEPEPSEEPEEELPEVPVSEIALADSDAGTAMFGNLTLAPGITVDRCIEVTYAGNVDPGPVLLYAASVSGALAPYLDLRIQIGSAPPGAFGTCSGFVPTGTLFTGSLAGFAAAHGSYASGLPTWDPADPQESRTFRFSVSVRDTPAAAAKTAAFGFSWRVEQR